LFREYKRQVFAAGCAGAYTFPGVAPLGLVSRAFTKEELKALAHSLRALSMRNSKEGKFTLGPCETVVYPGTSDITIFGPVLDVPIPDFSLDTVQYQAPTLVLCAALIRKDDEKVIQQDRFPQSPVFSFRAAMVANMIFLPLSSGAIGYSFEWKIGTPVWLPAYKKKKE
jgi:hypothetical protein